MEKEKKREEEIETAMLLVTGMLSANDIYITATYKDGLAFPIVVDARNGKKYVMKKEGIQCQE